MKRQCIVFAVAISFAVAATATSWAASPKPKSRRENSVHIVSVDPEAMTLTAEKGKETIEATLSEKVSISGLIDATWDDIADGSRVFVVGSVANDESSVDARQIILYAEKQFNRSDAIQKNGVVGTAAKSGDSLSVKVKGKTIKVDRRSNCMYNKRSDFEVKDLKPKMRVNLVGNQVGDEFDVTSMWVHPN